ncbi:hypothetical protein A3I34_02500 [Candidatus Jorgensenbacteria bacterium RIFCSPLOWO2_02_FULL_45_12]|uniref:Nudix hydrolase domain-containing protein n=2 Tax=Candidatus Joergenseniibacteriota TaxID=1752739 RepID=A0A1F6BNI6_9BACT|nr:MAG: hypothetical protein UX22_C0012G0003 [Candidatus Jorgensenbacteria bacterium GW2011_GWA2_45_9]OGG38332.1 MAG: hypothetical protein A3D55_01280 [Candidatus Jorgensenbacteria bacterium RIFCSPHIGHO2_02_FULL_45_20]OGG42626.1 MAG: hypothetical protein A3I34_02500 [Candidatus Jorgensenbacteria bacterium RIFCSPLOWO2_02_FULL_45_12]
MSKFDFQYCQKIVVFSKDANSVLLCKRKGENDYDGVYSFIGGKMENNDGSFIHGLQREKNEEVGEEFKIEIYPFFTTNAIFKKKSLELMILPHYYARHLGGEIKLNEEYSDFQWVAVKDLKTFEPKIPTIPDMVDRILKLVRLISPEELVQI